MIMRLTRTIGACIVASTLLPSILVHAATYYIATTGDNSNPGTETKPWQTVAYAVNTMGPGDTTYVRGGTYNEGLIRFRTSGKQEAPIKLLNYPGESPIIQCIDAKQVHRMIIHHASGERFPMGWITIEGLEIRNCYDSLKIHNGHDLTIRKNVFYNGLHQGILGNGTRILIDRNVIHHNGNTSGNQNHGIYMNGTGITITNNIIYDNQHYGIQANGSPSSLYSSSKHAGPEFAVSHDWVIANNTIAYNRNRAGLVIWGTTLKNLRVENNIFYENGVTLSSGNAQAIDFCCSATSGSIGIQIRNNLAYASGSGATGFLGVLSIASKYTQSDNIVNMSDPAFIKAPATLPDSPNFALTQRSPAIDAGLTITETKTDFLGAARLQGRAYDIGAYEYNAGGDAQAPTTPKGLQIN